MKKLFSHKLSLFLAIVILAGCSNFEIYPFVSFHRSPKRTEFALRPIFQITFDKEKGTTHFMCIPPLIDYKTKPDDKKFRIFPLVWWVDHRTEGGRDRDFCLFPIVFQGHSPDEGGYFALFPLGGNLKGLLAKDEIWFALFPLYTYTRDKDYKVHNILFPLIAYGKGEKRSLFRILPFYGKKKKERRYKGASFLWPFFNFSKERLDTKNPVTKYSFFPFFGREKSKNISAYTVLFPAFGYKRDKKQDYVAWNVLWILYQHAKGKDIEKNYFGPFFGYKTTKGKQFYYVLYPLFQKETEDFGIFKKDNLWILPFYWHHKKTFEYTGRKDLYVRLWPVVGYKKTKDMKEISGMRILPISESSDIAKFYSPLWRVFEYKKSEKETKFNLLWRLFKYERKKNKWNVTFLWFITLRPLKKR